MKNRKTIFTIFFALVLALSIVTVSAAAISANETKPGKPETKPDASVCEASGDCGVQPLKGFVEGLHSFTLEERATLLADLAEIERYENQINEIYSRMTDENAERLYAEIDAVDEKLTAVLARNAALWERVNDEYDEKIAANEPDMTLELNEADFDDACPAEESYADSIKSMHSLTEKEKAALLADLAEIEKYENQINELYSRMTDENAERLYAEIDTLDEKLTAVLERNSELWGRVNDEYDEKIAANEPDMTFELNEADFDDSCTAEASYEEFIKGMSSLTEKEKAALLADLAEIERYENQINELYSRMTDENAERLYAEIDTLDEKLTAVLERNSELWGRVNDEYDEKIAANEPDMTFELNEADFDDSCTAEASYEEFIKGMSSLTEKEKAALLADLAEIESLEAQIDELYYRMTDEDADRLYGSIDALYEKLDSVLDRNAELWDRVDAEYDEEIAAYEPDMTFECDEYDLAICGKSR